MNEKNILLFDGVCNFCNYWVNFIIRNDKRKIFLFAPLQSEAGRKIFSECNIPSSKENEHDSVILVQDGKYFLRSEVAIAIAKILGGKWFIVYFLLKIIPKFLRDTVYDFIAKNRYQWFGKRDTCMIPEEGVRERFLE